jgi:hypothetical protein
MSAHRRKDDSAFRGFIRRHFCRVEMVTLCSSDADLLRPTSRSGIVGDLPTGISISLAYGTFRAHRAVEVAPALNGRPDVTVNGRFARRKG